MIFISINIWKFFDYSINATGELLLTDDGDVLLTNGTNVLIT